VTGGEGARVSVPPWGDDAPERVEKHVAKKRFGELEMWADLRIYDVGTLLGLVRTTSNKRATRQLFTPGEFCIRPGFRFCRRYVKMVLAFLNGVGEKGKQAKSSSFLWMTNLS
jgi:hypothetical protein